PIIAVGSALMTIDAPFTCAWMGALVFAQRAAIASRGWWNWPAAGVCVMLGILAKHTMVLFVPCMLLVLATTPSLRGQLRQGGCWVMAALGALGTLPMLV